MKPPTLAVVLGLLGGVLFFVMVPLTNRGALTLIPYLVVALCAPPVLRHFGRISRRWDMFKHCAAIGGIMSFILYVYLMAYTPVSRGLTSGDHALRAVFLLGCVVVASAVIAAADGLAIHAYRRFHPAAE